MKKSLKKIIKITSFGIFFLALFLNLKISLENPYVQFSNAALAQTSSSSSSSGDCQNPSFKNCWSTISYRIGPITRYCGTCELEQNSAASGYQFTCWGC